MENIFPSSIGTIKEPNDFENNLSLSNISNTHNRWGTVSAMTYL